MSVSVTPVRTGGASYPGGGLLSFSYVSSLSLSMSLYVDSSPSLS